MCKADLRPSPNHSKMSVTNEDLSGSHQGITTGNGGGRSPTSLTRQPTSSSSTPGSATSMSTTPVTNGMGGSNSDVVKSGYLRKLKGKKKYFVLRKETDGDKPARLEYYATEKKFRMGQPPRKSIVLKACFNISGPETNLKSKYSISLHTHNDCVRISMSNEEELNEWLRMIKSLAGEEEDDEAIEGKPHFEHIWMVTALNKGLGSKENIIGPYRLCLTSKELTLLKVGEHDGRNGQVRFPLNVIRNVSHDATFGCFFHIELGRLASTGPGQLSLKTDDNNIAQNMHLLILKAMQNYSKDDLIPPRERARTYTWTNEATMRPSHSATPTISSSIDEPRIRTDSLPSSSSGRGIAASQMSPPVPILHSPPSIYFNSPNLYSTGTDSASSSYSIDYDNNNHSLHGEKSNDDEEYVPFSPMDDQHLSPKSQGHMKLPLNGDTHDCVDSGNAQTPCSYMEMQSPTSPLDNYLPMSPGGGIVSAGVGGSKCNGKPNVSHSRNSSLIEDTDGYVPMIPGHHSSRSESGAGSTAGSATGLDEAYLDMDFTQKINLSNDDMQRASSPASSESLQSNTPSTDFPLEKVTSYLTDDFDEPMRPIRAYSVGSRSDTAAVGKLRAGKHRLEAVQEATRMRAMSVGSKNMRRPPVSTASTFALLSGSGKSGSVGPLSSSWSGSTGRWPMTKYSNNQNHIMNQQQSFVPSFSQANSESTDSDLMELDFSKNKMRKRSHPGPPTSLNSTPSSTTSSNIKISPAPKGALVCNTPDGPSSLESPEVFKTPAPPGTYEPGSGRGQVISSAPISISRVVPVDNSYAFHEPSSNSQFLTRLTGTDLKRLKELDDEGAYLNMDFSKPAENPNPAAFSNNIVRPSDNNPAGTNPGSTAKFSLNLVSSSSNHSLPSPAADQPQPPLCNGELQSPQTDHPVEANVQPSDHTSMMKTLHAPSMLTRIEESPEKQEQSKPSSGSVSPSSPSRYAPLAKPEDDPVTYASIDHHLPTVCRKLGGGTGASNTCGTAATASSNKASGITYAQIDFVKNAGQVTPNS